jgi:Uma2 family endonuclease
LDVRLNAETLDDTVVQPDLVIICDHSKLDDAGCKGVPEMVVEVLSPSNSRYDKVIKFNRYLKAGIIEYWIVDPVTQTLAVNILMDNNYITHIYTSTEMVNVHVLKGCIISLSKVFAE